MTRTSARCTEKGRPHHFARTQHRSRYLAPKTILFFSLIWPLRYKRQLPLATPGHSAQCWLGVVVPFDFPELLHRYLEQVRLRLHVRIHLPQPIQRLEGLLTGLKAFSEERYAACWELPVSSAASTTCTAARLTMAESNVFEVFGSKLTGKRDVDEQGSC